MTEASEQSADSGYFRSFYSSLMKPSESSPPKDSSTELTGTIETSRSLGDVDSEDEFEESPLRNQEQRNRNALKRAAEARMNRNRPQSAPQIQKLEKASASPPSGGSSGMLSYLNPFSYMRSGANEPHEKNSDEG